MPHKDSEPLNSGRVFLLLLVYVLELTLGLFAVVALYHIIDEYNVFLIVFNFATAIFSFLVYWFVPNKSEPERRFLVRSILYAIALGVLRAVWQAQVSSEGAENISPTNAQEFYFTYLAFAVIRITAFIGASGCFLRLLWF